ncbi:MAG: C40 family peptidase [Cyanobacteria bacterium SID2]|nr:C40 family peptidase [Cyanobacteria bacterium SID2]MBP0005494.1 C40 family peptidase [Cyanobacteria bacterium SBC]
MVELNRAAEYCCASNLNLYDSPQCEALATQAATGRHLRIVSLPSDERAAIRVRLREDDYPGWLHPDDIQNLYPAETLYSPLQLSQAEIRAAIPQAIEFTYRAMAEHEFYLWGGTVSPNYDCSGLMQAAFASIGVWLPRDAYLQEAFSAKISIESLQPGDLVFFGTSNKANHVGLYLGNNRYIHSSGRGLGRNGIGIDELSKTSGKVGRNYFEILRSAGRITHSYQPGELLSLML